ncbi:unannotated protein [freshwater metagenome]|uniref:Unannotated protein n=1 Tax=freshwater metagenome TaxID=449393 RepID=A0A6J7E570_9ZZZZ|nr:hypothetical protein [Actinomycetota bacterium]
MNAWTFIYLMLVLKIPVAAMAWIVWWAVHKTPEAEPDPQSSDGGSQRDRHPRRPFPRGPRRGAHGEIAPASPPRTRPAVARVRQDERTER